MLSVRRVDAVLWRPEEASDPSRLAFQLQAAMWVLGTQLWNSARSAVSPAPNNGSYSGF